MKKILFLLLSSAVISTFSFAQSPAKKVEPKKQVAKAEVKAEAQSGATVESQKPKGKDTPKVAPIKTKKDGTPDMRFKENKENAKSDTTKKLKKDGTPDMRHKANKAKQ